MLYRATGNAKPIEDIKGWKEWRTSTIGYAESYDGVNFRIQKDPLVKPEFKWESMGCEDPRISKIGDTYFIFYTAVTTISGFLKVRLALAETKDFKEIKKHGPVGPNIPSNEGYVKAGSFFPEHIGGKLAMLFTWHSDSPESIILIAKFNNIKEFIKPSKDFWSNFLKKRKNHALISPTSKALRGPEVGATPIKTKKGWLLIYFGETSTKQWTINSALHNLKNPKKILWQSKGPILKPEKLYEKKGIVDNVTFPEGAVIKDGKLFVYYGAGDKYCCLATTTPYLTN